MNYQKIEIEPNSYEMYDDLGIPKQPSLFTEYTQDEIQKSHDMSKDADEIYNNLPEHLRDSLDPNCDEHFDRHKLLEFIKNTNPGNFTNDSSVIYDFKARISQYLLLLENNITIETIRSLFFDRTDTEFAIDLQFMRDNGVDIDKMIEEANNGRENTSK